VAVEPPQNQDDGGIHILTAEGTVEWIEAQAAGRLLESIGFEWE
jgi:hypothetical protein